ncbi:lipoprotein [Hymenobacter metallicola]|uniref:Type IV secretion system putative lipoprotein virB7 n=1 Tax=Hymenobacter metallicola TaxID=2563114 RepID=A0A4Z0QJZ7_9BACT|nr:lipoprotein [Hymenobacter metallicola]TGE29589.1 hypothetical protein E5K02_09080 [Hymenobacter metallicola]
MKHSLSFFGALLLLTGCNNSPEKRAEAVVSEYVSNRLDDPANYRADKFDTKPYTRQDSAAYAARVAQLNGSGPAAPAAPPVANGAAQIGTFVRHSYREQTKDGDVRRDSGEFVVSPKGDVIELIPGHRLK